MKRFPSLALMSLFALLTGLLRAESLKVGDQAPTLSGVTDSGATLDLGKTYSQNAYTVVWFYPKALTGGCTKQGCSLRDNWEALQKAGVAVLGVSTDDEKLQKEFKEEQKFPFRLLADKDRGERRLTNLLQLGELLQAASQQAEGETALVHWLATQVTTSAAYAPAGGADDPQILRLESDAELVRIVTVHKSKGLEYPVVFLPFATHFRESTEQNTAFVIRSEVVDGRQHRRLVLTPTDDDLAEAERERHREDLRLLYVAEAHRAEGGHVVLEHLSGALRHVGDDPRFHLVGRALERDAEVLAVHLAQHALDRAVVEERDVLEDEHALADLVRGLRRGVLEAVEDRLLCEIGRAHV